MEGSSQSWISVIVEEDLIAALWRVENAPEFLLGKRFSTVGTWVYGIRLICARQYELRIEHVGNSPWSARRPHWVGRKPLSKVLEKNAVNMAWRSF